jgi:CDP-2,3-bis-(O-geranylgeranyl)-sn-glycerol synthase
MIPLLFSLCCGALLGDVIESFFKRRIGKDRGQDWIPFDQLDFLIGALTFSLLMSEILSLTHLTSDQWFFQYLSIWHIIILLVVTPFIHLTANALFRIIKRKRKQKI